MNDLKLCPFCGSEALIDRVNVGADYKPWYWWTVHCANRECVCADLCHEYETEAKAIEAWNTRAERTCKRVLFEPTGVLVCSECGAGMPKQLDKYCYLHYCPNCGARVERRDA